MKSGLGLDAPAFEFVRPDSFDSSSWDWELNSSSWDLNSGSGLGLVGCRFGLVGGIWT